MRREQAETKIGGGKVRYVVDIYDDASEVGTIHAERRRHEFMNQLTMSAHLTHCGPVPFEELRVWHDGQQWRAQAFAIAEAT